METDSRTFEASLEKVRDAASDALASLGAKAELSSDGNTVSGKTGWSLMSFFGERVEINLEPQGDHVLVSVTSKQSRGQLLDLSHRNQKNVGSVLGAMTARLGS
jgi:hypothetical protein